MLPVCKRVSVSGFHLNSSTTSPRISKRKAAVVGEIATSKTSKKHKTVTPKAEFEPTLPVTPLTGTTPSTPITNKMDSEDEFMSGISSGDEFANIEDSDDGLGKLRWSCLHSANRWQ